MTRHAPPLTSPSLLVAVPLLGITQIISWGSLMYSVAVLAQPMATGLGVSTTTVFGAFSLSLGASGLASRAVGRSIDRFGGSAVLSAGSVVSALALAMLALAQGPFLLFAGWLLAGIAMSATLYDASFSALSQFAGARYRQALTALTLFGGFASTVFWPLSWYLDGVIGWRLALGAFALMHLLVCLPIHRYGLPRERVPVPPDDGIEAAAGKHERRRTFVWLATAFTMAAFVISATAAHGVGALIGSGLDSGTAILAASLIGPMQVVGRILEFVFARGVAASRVGLAAFAVMLLAMLLLWQAGLAPWLAFAFACAYGLSNGVMSIVRGTVPAELFGRNGYGSLMGQIAQPAFFAKAVAPILVATLISNGESYAAMALLLAALSAIALCAYVVAVRDRLRRP